MAKSKLRIVFFGCVEFSHSALELLLNHDRAEVIGVVTRRESGFNSDFRSLEPLARMRNIPVFFADENGSSQLEGWVRSLKAESIYCFGWSWLLPRSLIEAPELGTIGFHPAALPLNRGRHPIIWALALGLRSTASSFFFMDEGADSGDLLSQCPVTIDEQDDAASLYARITSTALQQIGEFTAGLADRSFQRVPQDHSKANNWRKRGKRDGQIDWRMSARSIYNLVRSLARPYPGAHCLLADGREARIWRSRLVSDLESVSNLEPGKVIRSEGRSFVVKCGEGLLEILEHEIEPVPAKGEYL